MNMKLIDVLQPVAFYDYNSDIEGVDIRDIANDSREVTPGTLFVCIKGYTVDGHDFIEESVQKGAVAIIAEKDVSAPVPVIRVRDTARVLAMIANKFYDFPTKHMPLIGVTGTNGKTTVTYLLEAIFGRFQKKTGLLGTIQLKIGEEAYPLANTTPDALSLQKTFRRMEDAHVTTAIMEVSSHGLDLGRVYGCDFDVAIFTNLSRDHLDYHKNMDDYIRAKSMLFAQLGNQYTDRPGKFAVLNVDDVYFSLLERSTSQEILTYGYENDAQVMAKDVSLTVSGTSFTLVTPRGQISIQSQMIGMFNVYNMLAASATALTQQVPLPIIKEALDDMKGVSGRFEPVVTANTAFTTIVDFAHTPDSLENVLETIKRFAKAKIYVVVGCGGDRDASKRPLMANVALEYASHAVFTSDNPRTEDPLAILHDMTDSLEKTHYEMIQDRRRAIRHVIDLAESDDIILIAGKGHETHQLINHTKYDFDDRVVAKEAMLEKR